MSAQECGTCRHWDDGTGRCHRYAPRPSTPNEAMHPDELWDHSLSVWPITEEGDWCGEWSAEDEDMR